MLFENKKCILYLLAVPCLSEAVVLFVKPFVLQILGLVLFVFLPQFRWGCFMLLKLKGTENKIFDLSHLFLELSVCEKGSVVQKQVLYF